LSKSIKKEFICENCGRPYNAYKSANRKYCSLDCRPPTWSKTETQFILENPEMDRREIAGKLGRSLGSVYTKMSRLGLKLPTEGKEKKRCLFCGKTFESYIYRKQFFCSAKCRTDHTIQPEIPGRQAAHEFIIRRKPKPPLCEQCKSKPPKDLASINGHNYTRDPKDYSWLCRKCHVRMDNGTKEKETKCHTCGSPFTHLRKNRKFCSRECFYRSRECYYREVRKNGRKRRI
jgi:protein-arginine kinase activator protein McsA